MDKLKSIFLYVCVKSFLDLYFRNIYSKLIETRCVWYNRRDAEYYNINLCEIVTAVSIIDFVALIMRIFTLKIEGLLQIKF